METLRKLICGENFIKQRWIKKSNEYNIWKRQIFFIVTNIKRVWNTGGKGVGGQ